MTTTITNYAGLVAIADDLAGSYILGNDIDASGQTFTPLGTFTGTLDGDGFSINDLTITVSGSDYQNGAFIITNEGTIRDVNLTDCVISVTSTGKTARGAPLVRKNEGIVNGCSATGTITCTGNIAFAAWSYAGGLVCTNYGSILNSYSTVTVTVVGNDTGAGGFIYYNIGTIARCFATGDTSADAVDDAEAAGFICENDSSGDNIGVICDCYARGNSTATNDAGGSSYAGGFIAINEASSTIDHAYSIGTTTATTGTGGFCASDSGTITGCFWDTETSGDATSNGGTGKTTTQMTTTATFTAADWDFKRRWNRNDCYNDGYPYFRWYAADQGWGDQEERPVTITVTDDKGRIPKGAIARAYDTSAPTTVIETETLDSNGQATFTELPNDTDVIIRVNWGGESSASKEILIPANVLGVSGGGTGSSDVTNARSNLGLGSEDSPQFTGIELGHATDTTITRDAAGIVSIEGKRITRSAAYIIAANDSEIKTQADYICDGTNDHVQIQAAIDALPVTGGDVLLLDGTYNIESSITLDSYQALRGCGRNTILTTTTANINIITATGSAGNEKVGILLADFCIDGDAGGVTPNDGIEWTYVDDSTIRNVWSMDSGSDGICLESSSNNKIIGNTCWGNTSQGIAIYICPTGNIVVGNNCQNNAWGIFVDESPQSVVADNICIGNSYYGIEIKVVDCCTITGNVCQGNTYDGISTDASCCKSAFVGNICNGNDDAGIYLYRAYNNTVAGNICQGNGEHGIRIERSDDNTISDNNATENSQNTTNSFDDIFVVDSEYNTIQGNTCRAGDETPKPRYGINISDADSIGNKVIDNDLYDDGFGTGDFNDSGTGTIYVEPGIDDTPVDGETGQPISSNWAYDHVATGAHSYMILDAGLVTAEIATDNTRVSLDLGGI